MRMRDYTAPLIVIAEFPDESGRAHALKAGVTCVLGKPFAAPNLIAGLEAGAAPTPSQK
jgi:DNA-binding response OmpR family regulator